jgi:hypothetical protein
MPKQPVEISIEHIDDFVASMHGASGVVQEHVSDAIDTVLGGMMRQLADEPPELPNQRYRRTHQLSNEWRNADTKWRLPGTAFLRNTTPYGLVVQDAQFQARIHRGRWPTVQGVLANNADVIEQALRQAGDDALKEIAEK